MQFREYRRKETIRLAEIQENRLILEPGYPESKNNNEHDPSEFFRGDYVENRGDKLYGWRKADVDTMFVSVRNRRPVAAKPRKKPTKERAAAAGIVAPSNSD